MLEGSDADVANTKTVVADEPAASGAGDFAADLAAWDRYQVLELLGKGGMGMVYKAHDRQLQRTLALKFLLGADPDMTMRFLREARAQARIDHPGICRVYDAGEYRGRAYIALQLIVGEPLNKAAGQMSTEEKVAVMRDVALAIQDAHALGIIHRDLKPANVMVAHGDDGRWTPVVMDFGLARETTLEAGLTISGAVLGTPAYMAPEQARGEMRALDRRTDVYGLGATFYELLTGRAPFSGASLAEVLVHVMQDDPPAPRSLVPALPIDLATIALKCMAKDPDHRYPTARALADDLGRYLAGESIVGRPLSLWQRARRRARRHRALVTLGAASFVAIIGLSAFGVRASLRSRAERERAEDAARLAGQLGQEATAIEADLREAYLLPLHDTRPDRARVRERMARIAQTHHDLGALGDAIVHDALGRGHLALHEWQQAADELRLAMSAGHQSPELHATLGRALGELYRTAADGARYSDDTAWLERKEQELVAQYLTPALAELEHSRGSGEDAALLDARILLYRRQFADAEQRARELASRSPGLAEAHKLAGDAAYGAALAAFDHGDYDAARAALDRAASLYSKACEIARSDASLYDAGAQAALRRAQVAYRQAREIGAPIDQALDAVAQALRADPDDATAYTIKANVLLRRYRASRQLGVDVERSLLQEIAQAAGRAVEIDTHDVKAWTALGNAFVYRGIYEFNRSSQAAAWWTRARDSFEYALAIQPDDPRTLDGIGTAYRWLGTDKSAAGEDPTSEYQLALRSYERATALDPQFVAAWTNQADLYATIAEYETDHHRDPHASVASAQSAGERARALGPKSYGPLNNLARAQLALADYLVNNGNDPMAALTSARGYLDSYEALGLKHLAIWFFRLEAARIEATFQVRRTTDPRQAVSMGRDALREALLLEPDSAYCYIEAVRLDLAAAAWASRVGSGAAALLSQARRDADKAIELNARDAAAWLVAAEASLQSATAQPSHAIIERGIGFAEKALDLNSQLRRAREVRAALLQLQDP